MIFDTHAHYLDSRFDEDREILLKSFNSNGVKYVTEVCASADDIDNVYNFTKKYDFVFGALGVHPSETDKLTENDINRIKELAMDEKIVAVGEIGLDYHFEDDPSPEIQKKWFIRQMEVAKEVGLPIIVHSRDAAKDTLDIMKDIETGIKKFGAMLGDNVEVGCNSVLNPGSVLGKGCSVYPTSCVRGVIPAGYIYKSKTEISCRL